MHFILGVLATWRLSHLIAYEDGPVAILARLRRALRHRVLGDLMDCFYCVSIYAGMLCAPVVASGWEELTLCSLAFSGGACLLERWAPRVSRFPSGS